MKYKLATLFALGVISGCSGASYAIQHYASVPVKSFASSSGSSYRIYDKPSENRLMITPSIGASMSGGAVKGVTWGIVNPLTGTALYRSTAEEFLRSRGRDCTVKKIELIIEPQYEARYECTLSEVASK